MIFNSLPNRGRIFFKNSSGTVLTSAFAYWGPLTSTDTRFTTPQGEVKNTSLFIVFFSQRRLSTRLIDQGHYIWINETEYFLITGLEDFGNQTTFVGLRQSITSGFAPSESLGIVSEWAFVDSSNLVTDSQGLNNLTNVNTVAWDSDKPSQIPFNLGSALFASASSEQLRITDASQSQLDITGTITIAFRMKATSLPGGGARMNLLAKSAAAPNLGYEVFISNAGGNKIQFKLSQDGSTDNNCNGATAISISIWYSVVCVYNGTDARVYLNGSLDSNGSENPFAYTSGFFNNAENFALGARSSSADYFNGRLAHVLIFNQAKSASDIATWHSTDVWPS